MTTESSKRSLKGLYFSILTHIADNMSNEDKLKFELWSCEDISKSTLETNEPLRWFSELQRKEKIAPHDLLYLEEFLKCSDHMALVKTVKNYKARRQAMLKSKKKAEETTNGVEQAEAQTESDTVVDKESSTRKFYAQEKIKQDRGLAFDLCEDEVESLLGNSTLRGTEKSSFLFWKLQILAHQMLRQSINVTGESTHVQSQIVENSSDSQCSSDRNQISDIGSLSSSIESLERRISNHSKILTVAGLGVLALFAIFNMNRMSF